MEETPIKVFCSYHSADKPRVLAIARRLREAGIDAWVDDWEIAPGDDLVARINEGLAACPIGLIFLSGRSLGSAWAQAEANTLNHFQIEQEKRVIPVMLDPGTPLPPLLRGRVSLPAEPVAGLVAAIHGDTGRPALGKRRQTDGFLAELPPASRAAREMVRAAYLLLRVDQFSPLLKTGDPQDLHLWGWSVCDPERKERVARPQTEESRAASLVVSSFVHSALAAAPGGHDFSDVVDGLLDTLALRFRPAAHGRGVFGTVQTRVVNADGQRDETIYRNCRHIASAVMILLRLLRGEWFRRGIPAPVRLDLARKAMAAVKYLMDLEDDALFSQNPDGLGAPDSGTCAIVLEMLSALGSAEALAIDEAGGPSRQRLEEWRAARTGDGLFLLERRRFPIEGHGGLFWDYGRDRKLGLRDPAPPATDPARVDLYHTARNLYLLRNLLAQPECRQRLAKSIDGLANLCRQNGNTLPSSFPGGAGTHVTNTAFFLNALVADSGEIVDERFRPLLEDGVVRLADAFLDRAPERLQDLLELRADGFAMLLRLARCWPTLEVDFGALENASREIQQTIAQHQGDDSALLRAAGATLSPLGLDFCAPVLLDRVHQARKRWRDGIS